MGGPLNRYRSLVDAGDIEADPAQLAAAERLDRLAQELAAGRPRGGLLGWLSGARPAPAARGLYLHGGVGRGKTMLMDLFFEAVRFAPKRRQHFHQFMADAQDRIAAARKTLAVDPIASVGAALAAEAKLLCFDELFVTDIADAMILSRLFAALLERGVVVVATSNAHPHELYRNGLNRQLFLPFIDLLEDHSEIIELKAAKDFRLEKLAGEPLYFVPADAAATAAMDRMWSRLTGQQPAQAADIEVKGRKVQVPMAAMGVARFSFEELCERPLGSLDYLAIAEAFHTLLIDGIPRLGSARRNEARRFITLIDTLYDRRVGLVASAEAEPDQLYVAGDGADLFQRTASRLVEMRSAAYLAGRAERAGLAVKIS